MENISKEMLEAAFNAMSECVAILDGQGRIWWLNNAGTEKLPPVGSFNFTELTQVKECIKTGAEIKNSKAVVNVRGEQKKGVLSINAIMQGGPVVGYLVIFRPDLEMFQGKKLPEELPFRSEMMRALRDRILKLANINSTILFTGESGTGKAMFSKLLHDNSTRAQGPFVVIDCLASDENELTELILGAGEIQSKLEFCEEGTLLIKNIERMPLKLQARLFDILRTKRVARIDQSRTIGVDARILISTSADLQAAVNAGRFREDLFNRISVMNVHIPPLREHIEDIPPLAWYFVLKYAETIQKEITGFTAGAVERLCANMWQGNIRQLEDLMAAAVDLCDGKLITEQCIPKQRNTTPSLGKMTAGFEKERVYSLLKLYGDSVEGKKKVAAELNIGLSTLYRILGRRG